METTAPSGAPNGSANGTVDAQQIENDEQRKHALKKVIPAAGIGHFVEWFDFGLYGTLATVISLNFFQKGDTQAAMLSTFAVFAAGFVMRPLGGIFWGSLGDRFGRKNILAIVVLSTSGATFLMGVLPTWQNIGIWAAVLLVLMRLIQGFAAGGESSGATALLTEYAPSHRRGLYSSLIDVFGFVAFLVGAGLVFLMSWLFGTDALNSWAWRIPFLLALPLGWVGIYLREKLEDTPEFRAAKESGKIEKNPIRTSLRTSWRALLFCVGFVIVKSVGHWMLQTFMPSYLQTDLGYNQLTSYGVTVIGFVVIVALCMPFGLLSDKIGRRPVMIAGCVGFVVLSYPTLMLMNAGSFWAATAAMALLGVFMAAIDGAINAAMAELFPTNLRYGSLSLSYNIAVAIFGGLTPYLSTALITWTGNKFAPAFLLMAAALISGITFVMAKETAFKPLKG
ncbi:MAG: MFS transporter [Bifidobacteriaceae bacterium]|jgi:MHS family proline/betaine transporter-like MFS transporter|nr:MFS transporter [Bifidobacteriaceae bacterium]